MPRTKKAASRGSGKGRGGHGKNNRGPAADLEVSFLPFAGTVPLGTARHNKNGNVHILTALMNLALTFVKISLYNQKP
jgi:hypothetical protein